jgi:hypothetical protein
MSEKDTLFSSKAKHGGIFSFKDFYQFCYDWLTEETGLHIQESKYEEKITGDSKEIEIEWEGSNKLTDYFQFDMKVSFTIRGLKEVEITQDGKKIKTNQGSVTVKIKGILVRDHQGKFESSGSQKFMRAIYEKWVIPSRIDEYGGKVIGDCDEFLGEVKSYLALEGQSRH